MSLAIFLFIFLFSSLSFLSLRTRSAKSYLKQLREDSGTGPDLTPAIVLKRCANSLALPVAKLARRIIDTGEWPRCWREHWILPLHKRGALSDCDRYRGIQLTAQLSKVVERFLAPHFAPRLDRLGAFGSHQFAYCHGRGARDAIFYVVLRWLCSFSVGRRIALYCSDVSGAFDRVDAARLLSKLRGFGVDARPVAVISSWLESRSARVIVQGHKSKEVFMINMVYQGTVWGPVLWITFFSDACFAIRAENFEEVMFADDLNAFQELPAETTDDAAFNRISAVQSSLHRWGQANRVQFDASKESQHILCRRAPAGPGFKLLGVQFDTKLLMNDAINECAHEAGWRTYSILRSRRYHTDAELVLLFKAHVLSYLEYRTPALFHASASSLLPVDSVLIRFLRAVNISESDALFYFNLAPLPVRRDIAMLGVVHRSALGLGPPQLHQFFRPAAPSSLARAPYRHSRHREEPDFQAPDFLLHSTIGMSRIYNLLPDSIIVSRFAQDF